MTTSQEIVLAFVANNPGCCAMDVVRWEWQGRGHWATYARIDRLVRRGELVKRRASRGRMALYVRGAAPAGEV